MTAILFASVLAMSADPTYDRELLSTVADGHRQSRNAIVTLHVKAKVLATNQDRPDTPRQHMAIEWWQSGSDWRSCETIAHEATPPAKADILPTRYERLHKGSTIKVLNVMERSGAIGDADQLVTPLAPWKWGLFQLQDRPPVAFADLFKDKKAVLNVAREGTEAKRLVVVQFARTGGWTTRVWFDPSMKYLARKRVDELAGGKSRIECEIETFREAKPGIFFPIKGVSRWYTNGKLNALSTVEATVEVNDPVKGDVFALQFPDRVSVADKAKGIEYVTGPDGEPLPGGPVQPIPPANDE